jgi:hypothetical protein
MGTSGSGKEAGRIQPGGLQGQLHSRPPRRHAEGIVSITILVVGGAASAALAAWSRRAAAPAPEDGTRLRAISQLGEGRFRIRGRVVPFETTESEVDGARCVFVLRASVDPSEGLLRDVAHELRAFSFRVEDGTGAVEVDPHHVIVDAPAAHGEAGLVVEQRLRAGEEVEVVASFRPCSRGCAPYRGAGTLFEPVPDETDPPRVSPSRESPGAGVVTRADVAIARAAALAVLGVSALLGWLVG